MMMIMTIEVNRHSNNSDNDNDINIPDPPWFFLIFQTGLSYVRLLYIQLLSVMLSICMPLHKSYHHILPLY